MKIRLDTGITAKIYAYTTFSPSFQTYHELRRYSTTNDFTAIRTKLTKKRSKQ